MKAILITLYVCVLYVSAEEDNRKYSGLEIKKEPEIPKRKLVK